METIYDHNFKKEEIPSGIMYLSAVAQGLIDISELSEAENLFLIAMLYLVREDNKKMDEYEKKLEKIDPELAFAVHQIRYPDIPVLT